MHIFLRLQDRPSGFARTWILCGQRWIELWIQVNPARVPTATKWPSRIDQNAWRLQLDSLTKLGQLTFVEPKVWGGLHISSELLRPVKATDWIVVQGRTARAGTSPELLDGAQIQLDYNRPWNQDEEYALVSLRKEKKTFAEITRKLGREELQVACKYVDLVPLPSSSRTIDPPNSELITTERLLICIAWVGYECTGVNGNEGVWKVFGYVEIHCESQNGF